MKTENKYCKVGDRVIRGPDWDWNNQDGGEGCTGTIEKFSHGHKKSACWNVRWDSPEASSIYHFYHMNDDRQDLTVLPKLNELTIPTQWGMRRVFCRCNNKSVSCYTIGPATGYIFEKESYHCPKCNMYAWVYKNKEFEPKT